MADRRLRILICGNEVRQLRYLINKHCKQTKKHSFFIKRTASYFKMLYIYLDSEMVLLPSLYESFGFVASEAMACGIPVISSKIGSLAELTGEDGNVIFIPSSNSEELAKAILYFLDNPGKRVTDRKKILERLAWLKSASNTYNLYCKITNTFNQRI